MPHKGERTERCKPPVRNFEGLKLETIDLGLSFLKSNPFPRNGLSVLDETRNLRSSVDPLSDVFRFEGENWSFLEALLKKECDGLRDRPGYLKEQGLK